MAPTLTEQGFSVTVVITGNAFKENRLYCTNAAQAIVNKWLDKYQTTCNCINAATKKRTKIENDGDRTGNMDDHIMYAAMSAIIHDLFA